MLAIIFGFNEMTGTKCLLQYLAIAGGQLEKRNSYYNFCKI